MSGKVGDNLFRASGVVASAAADTYDDSQIQSNVAMLGFKVAVNGSLTRYNLVDQSIDEFYDTSGVDASASTNDNRVASGSNYYYSGNISGTATQDADATGVDGDYTWYKWTDTAATGSYNYSVTADHEYLIVGGGGSGGRSNGGAGGGGGLLTATGLSLTGGNAYTVTIGAGGVGVSSGTTGNVGGDSILSGTGITTLTAGGGGYGNGETGAGGAGRSTNGSGGGSGYNQATGGAGDGTGGDGGGQTSGSPEWGAGGGGGAGANGAAGTSSNGGDGGVGVANDIIETGTDVYYAGGGGGCANVTPASAGAGGNGGGGAGNAASSNATAGTANTGGGGGGANSADSGTGGSGIVILRRLTAAGTTYSDMTLQSTDVTAVAEPDFGEFVTLIENAAGTATLNTDIKGYISRDSGTTFTQGTLVDEGTWGTNKKVLGFHDLDISSQPSGTSMCYKITTHNQAIGLQTGVYATSIGWR